jgi:hypothetical protein
LGQGGDRWDFTVKIPNLDDLLRIFFHHGDQLIIEILYEMNGFNVISPNLVSQAFKNQGMTSF